MKSVFPLGYRKNPLGGKPKLMALPGHGENLHRQSLLSFRETKTFNYNTFVEI